jgi:hypothetical protein
MSESYSAQMELSCAELIDFYEAGGGQKVGRLRHPSRAVVVCLVRRVLLCACMRVCLACVRAHVSLRARVRVLFVFCVRCTHVTPHKMMECVLDAGDSKDFVSGTMRLAVSKSVLAVPQWL